MTGYSMPMDSPTDLTPGAHCRNVTYHEALSRTTIPTTRSQNKPTRMVWLLCNWKRATQQKRTTLQLRRIHLPHFSPGVGLSAMPAKLYSRTIHAVIGGCKQNGRPPSFRSRVCIGKIESSGEHITVLLRTHDSLDMLSLLRRREFVDFFTAHIAYRVYSSGCHFTLSSICRHVAKTSSSRSRFNVFIAMTVSRSDSCRLG